MVCNALYVLNPIESRFPCSRENFSTTTILPCSCEQFVIAFTTQAPLWKTENLNYSRNNLSRKQTKIYHIYHISTVTSSQILTPRPQAQVHLHFLHPTTPPFFHLTLVCLDMAKKYCLLQLIRLSFSCASLSLSEAHEDKYPSDSDIFCVNMKDKCRGNKHESTMWRHTPLPHCRLAGEICRQQSMVFKPPQKNVPGQFSSLWMLFITPWRLKN